MLTPCQYFINSYAPPAQVSAIIEYGQQSVVVSASGGDLAPVREACKAAKVGIVLGISERVKGGHQLFNSLVFINSAGTLLGTHRKLQPTYAERYIWSQGSGHTLRTYGFDRSENESFTVGGLCCWENTMNLARQSLIESGHQILAAAWPALSTTEGFEAVADIQIEALAKNHALTAQVFVICASNYVDEACLEWLDKNIGPQTHLDVGGGWSAVVHPFCKLIAGPVMGKEGGDQIITAEVDLNHLNLVKVYVDANGHFKRPEILKMQKDSKPLWEDDEIAATLALK
jgi:predicted amidohydrolase